MESKATGTIRVFYIYASEDEFLRKELEKHLMILSRQKYITSWQSYKITNRRESNDEIAEHIKSARLILLLVSPDFLASDYCYETEMQQILERNKAGDTLVVPILLRPVDWEGTSFAQLQALPINEKPVTSWAGRNGRDKAFVEISFGIRAVIEIIKTGAKATSPENPTTSAAVFKANVLTLLYASKIEMLFGSGRYQETIEIYEEALRLDPTDALSWGGKADALYQLERYQEAVVSYEEALRLDPTDTLSWRGKADALYQLERYQEAITGYVEALRLDRTDALSWRGTGKTLYKLGHFQESKTDYERALRLDRTDAASWRGRGESLYKLGHLQDAKASYEEALRLDPNNVLNWSSRGEALYELGHYEEALECYEEALRLDPYNALSLYRKGEILCELERYKEALASYESARAIHEKILALKSEDPSITLDIQRETALQTHYTEKLSEFILKGYLSVDKKYNFIGDKADLIIKPKNELLMNLATSWTLMMLHLVSRDHIRQVLEFLSDNGLMNVLHLNNAYLRGANLQKMDLTGANLQGADLQGANLQEADLLFADLRKADFRGANLSKANLMGAKLDGAYLGRANLTDVMMPDGPINFW